MKIRLQNRLAAAAVCSALVSAGAAHAAAMQAGQLGTAADASDMYTITCGASTTAYLEIAVRDELPNAKPTVSAQGINSKVYSLQTASAQNTSDRIDGNADFSPLVRIEEKSGAFSGVYTVIVNKSHEGAEAYTLSYQCKDSGGNDTNPMTPPVPYP